MFTVAAPGTSNGTEYAMPASVLHDRPVTESFDAAHAGGIEHSAGSRAELTVTRKAQTGSHLRLVDSLRHGHLNLARNNLWAARKNIAAALAVQPGNPEAQQMRADLVSREHERAYLLAYARLCARDGQWACARDNAAYALGVDASSRAARRLLSRANAAQQAGFINTDESDARGIVR
ncbi:hypothetical protein PWP93_33375 [Paraburkholderia sp. A1RI-2L]|uniref:hypothetical protein n=1 Tax=Paraburkholderia sp. A1RI-2L TaxID=3028367 RepID=UPI003B80A3F8